MKIGLVFSGGGAKGAYEIGVWKALKKLRLDKHIKVISGTSIGALNAVLFVNGDYDKAENIWKSLTLEQIAKTTNENLNIKLTPFIEKLMFPQLKAAGSYIKSAINKYISIGSFSQETLKEFIEKNIDFKKLKSFNGTCYVSVFNNKLNKPEYIKLNNLPDEKIVQYLLATTAMPIIFDKVIIDGNEYYDGGIPFFGANTPIAPVIKEKCDIIIAVTTNQWGDFWAKEKNESDAKIYWVIPQEDLWNFLDGTFAFNQEDIKRRMQQGYKEGMRVLKSLSLIPLKY